MFADFSRISGKITQGAMKFWWNWMLRAFCAKRLNFPYQNTQQKQKILTKTKITQGSGISICSNSIFQCKYQADVYRAPLSQYSPAAQYT